VDFRLLHARLVSHLRARVRNGELSERGLARLAGVSQPHVHNVLKGARLLSTDMADQILQHLRIDLADLLTADDVRSGGHEGLREPGDFRAVGLLDGWIGREHPYPQVVGRERYPFPAAAVNRLESPVAARLARDPLRAPIFSGPGVVLLDRAEAVRVDLDEEGYFAVDLGGAGTIGLVRRSRGHSYLWVRHGDGWQSMPLPDRAPTDVIQGRVSLVVRQV